MRRGGAVIDSYDAAIYMTHLKYVSNLKNVYELIFYVIKFAFAPIATPYCFHPILLKYLVIVLIHNVPFRDIILNSWYTIETYNIVCNKLCFTYEENQMTIMAHTVLIRRCAP